jgi:predicted metal-dependent enzyme (double-stranded beta helix superfamily)
MLCDANQAYTDLESVRNKNGDKKMPQFTVPAFDQFINDMRVHCAKDLPETEHWEGVRGLLRVLCADQAMREASQSWPARRGVERVLHHDPDYGFFVGGLIRQPNHRANVHDHAHTWTIYGVLDGAERTHVYKRLDDKSVPGKATLELLAQNEAPTGTVDIVPPWVPHSEWGMGERSVAITVRSERPGNYAQTRFDMEAGTCNMNHRGLKLIPQPV